MIDRSRGRAISTSYYEGGTFIKVEIYNKRFVQIDIDELAQHQNEVKDLLDMIMAKSRQDDEGMNWKSN